MKYGFLGCGNMGGAIAGALSKVTKDILVTDRSGKAKELARELGINPNTVAKAYSQLEADGITYSVPGKGSFISGDILRMGEVRRKMLEGFTDEARKARSLGVTKEELTGILDEVFAPEQESGE